MPIFMYKVKKVAELIVEIEEANSVDALKEIILDDRITGFPKNICEMLRKEKIDSSDWWSLADYVDNYKKDLDKSFDLGICDIFRILDAYKKAIERIDEIKLTELTEATRTYFEQLVDSESAEFTEDVESRLVDGYVDHCLGKGFPKELMNPLKTKCPEEVKDRLMKMYDYAHKYPVSNKSLTGLAKIIDSLVQFLLSFFKLSRKDYWDIELKKTTRLIMN